MTPADFPSGLGGQPVVQPDGTVDRPVLGELRRCGGSFRSTDGGKTWTTRARRQRRRARRRRRTSAPSRSHGRGRRGWQGLRGLARLPVPIELPRRTTSSSAPRLTASRGRPSPESRSTRPTAPSTISCRESRSTKYLGRLDASRARLLLLPGQQLHHDHVRPDRGFVSSLDGGATWTPGEHSARPMKVTWIARHEPGPHGRRLHLDLVHGRREGAPCLLLAKAPDSGVNGSCYPNNTGCHQRLTSVSVDITQPPPVAPVRTRREPIARGLHRHPRRDAARPADRELGPRAGTD